MDVCIATILILAAAALRLAPHAPNFAPVGALALFAGTVLPKRWSVVLPVGAMLLSDAIIGFYQPYVLLAVYGSFLAIVLLGWWAREQKMRAASVIGASLFGSVLFFLVTNAAVWAWGGLYSRTAAGLLLAYTMGVPFFRNTLASDLVYNGVLFGVFAAATWAARHAHWLRDRAFLRSPYH